MLKLCERKFKITVINTLTFLMAKVNNAGDQMGNFCRGMGTWRNNWKKTLKIKTTVMQMNTINQNRNEHQRAVGWYQMVWHVHNWKHNKENRIVEITEKRNGWEFSQNNDRHKHMDPRSSSRINKIKYPNTTTGVVAVKAKGWAKILIPTKCNKPSLPDCVHSYQQYRGALPLTVQVGKLDFNLCLFLTVCRLLGWASFTYQNAFKIYPCYFMNWDFAPFHGWVASLIEWM